MKENREGTGEDTDLALRKGRGRNEERVERISNCSTAVRASARLLGSPPAQVSEVLPHGMGPHQSPAALLSGWNGRGSVVTANATVDPAGGRWVPLGTAPHGRHEWWVSTACTASDETECGNSWASMSLRGAGG